jgi:hypothetical protein
MKVDSQDLHEPQEPPLQLPHPQELLEEEEEDLSVPCEKQTERARLVSRLSHLSHGMGVSASFMGRMVSNLVPQSWQTYS